MNAKIHVKYVDGTARELETDIMRFAAIGIRGLLIESNSLYPQVIKELIVKPLHADGVETDPQPASCGKATGQP